MGSKYEFKPDSTPGVGEYESAYAKEKIMKREGIYATIAMSPVTNGQSKFRASISPDSRKVEQLNQIIPKSIDEITRA